MSVEHIKEYLSMALDMEKNIYIQEKVISRLDSEIGSLGHTRKFTSPKKGQADVSFGTFISVGALIACFIGYLIEMVTAMESSSGIFGGIGAIFKAINWNLLWWALGGAVLGLFVALIKYTSEQGRYDDYYNEELRKHEQKTKDDNERVKKENTKKQALITQRRALYDKYEESCNNIDKFYSCGLIEDKYRNLVAIATIYQYFCEQRTYSLGFNPQTGDQGAYNIYNTEKRQDIIIDKLDVIAEKLDTVIENQEMIANTLRDANRRIDNLSNSINRGFKNIGSAIDKQTALIEYNDERKLAEQRYLSNLVTWGYMDSQINK